MTPQFNKGQPVRAADMNRIHGGVRSMELGLGGPHKDGSEGYRSGARGRVVCKGANESNAPLSKYETVIIRGTANTDPSIKGPPVLRISPSNYGEAADSITRIAVVLESIPAGGVGRICVGGIVQALSDGGTGPRGAVEPGGRRIIVSDIGPVEVLGGSGTPLVTIRIGGGGGAADTDSWKFVWNEGA